MWKTYPLSRKDFNWLLVNLRGSPALSAATASNSSKGGRIKRSRKFIARDLRFVPVVFAVGAETTPVAELVSKFIPDCEVTEVCVVWVDEIGCGKSEIINFLES